MQTTLENDTHNSKYLDEASMRSCYNMMSSDIVLYMIHPCNPDPISNLHSAAIQWYRVCNEVQRLVSNSM